MRQESINTLEQVKNAMLAIQRYPWEQGVCAQALYELQHETWVCMAHDAVLRQQPDGREQKYDRIVAHYIADALKDADIFLRHCSSVLGEEGIYCFESVSEFWHCGK